MTEQTIAAARDRLRAAARAFNEHIAGCGPCGIVLQAAARVTGDRISRRDREQQLAALYAGRCGPGAIMAAEVTAAGMELDQERRLTDYADTH